MKKILFILMFAVLLIGIMSADSLGTFKQGDCITLYQTCDDCSYVNLTAVKYPNGTLETLNLEMTKTNQEFNYTFCNTTTIGSYTYTVAGDRGGSYTTEVIEFEINYFGKELSVA
jgi:hypothetical protein